MISVIVPIYNVEHYIAECLESIINQTYKNIEIICIDDCGLDNSISIVKKYMKLDNRITLIHHERNKGLGESRNSGIEIAKGEYIYFIDSDDKIDKEMLKDMYNAMNKYKTDAAMCDIELFYQDSSFNRTISPFFYLENISSRIISINNKYKLIDINPSASNKLFKASIIKKYNIKFPKGLYEDHYFFYNYFIHAKNIYYINKSYYKYRQQRIGSILTSSKQREHEIYQVLDSIIPLFDKNFGDNATSSIIKVYFRLLWERAWTLNNNTGNNKYFLDFLITSRKKILALSGNKNFLKGNIDSFIPEQDFFHKIVFGKYPHNLLLFFLKRKLKKYQFFWKLKHKLKL
ncbi:glycosyltransferase family 2 protein [Avibacterium avium]|uniref:glycosyltransferase family 2 protein n=1 Tax=Avibacterium avium TaxID=751 RepID=UPI003BF85CAB